MWSTFVALGDSLAEGWGDPAGGERPRSWNDWVADGLRARNATLRYVNLGWRGSTVADVRRDQVPAALTTAPDLATVTVGANDALSPGWSVATFEAQLRGVIEPLVDSGATVATFTYPRAAGTASGRRTPPPPPVATYLTRLGELNAAVRSVSGDLGAVLLDFEAFAPACEPGAMSADQVHPNARGYLLLGQVALQRLLARSGPGT
jgi:lysophospholipase L1-like esterase